MCLFDGLCERVCLLLCICVRLCLFVRARQRLCLFVCSVYVCVYVWVYVCVTVRVIVRVSLGGFMCGFVCWVETFELLSACLSEGFSMCVLGLCVSVSLFVCLYLCVKAFDVFGHVM